MQMMASKDQEQPAFLKFLPLMIGWFSLNVPAALGIYWVANNFITTALTLQIRSSFKDTPVIQPDGGASAAIMDTKPISFTPAPIREKPAGFGASTSVDEDDVTPITPSGDVTDAEIVSDGEDNVSTSTKKKKKKKGKK
jgi:YidC/Oxa1 family membrane protein insertase